MHNQHQPMIEKELRNTAQLAAWTLFWVAVLALARFGPEHLWNDQKTVNWIAVAVSLLVGIGWIAAHARFLRELDDLQRKINMDALAITLGVGLVAGFTYAVAGHAGIVTVEGNIALLPILMAVVYVVAILIGNMRYR